jgi:SNF2 family DNA or RNA helicase
MRRPLLPHQEDALLYLSRNDRAAALFMEMRLGKTLSVIRHAQNVSVRSALIVAPKTTLVAWGMELDLEGERFHEIGANGPEARLREVSRLLLLPEKGLRLWFLTSYDSLRSTPELTTFPWDLVCLDESTRIKNPSVITTAVCAGGTARRVRYPGFANTARKIILSGLPRPESDLDLFSQFKFLDGQFMGQSDFYKFRHRYYRPGFVPGEWIARKGTPAVVKETFHSRAFIRTRQECGMANRKMYQQRHIDLPAPLRREYKRALKEFAAFESETKWAPVVDLWLRRIAGGFTPEGELVSSHKIKELTDLLTDELRKEPVVVWFSFRAEIDAAADSLRALKVSFAILHGDTTQKDRKTALRDFKAGKVRVLLAQVRVGRYGIDCSRADTAIYFSNECSCEGRIQSEDRIVHPQKDVSLLIIDLVTKDTVDQDIVDLLKDKTMDAKMLMRRLRERLLQGLAK